MQETQPHSQVEPGSDRSFGLVFAVVFAIIGVFPLIHSAAPRLWSLAVAVGFLMIALIVPGVLRPANRLWFQFGMLLAKIVNPFVMLVIYIVAFVPIGLTLRLLRKDLLGLKMDPDAGSYWLSRTPAGPEPQSLKDQF